MLPQYTILSIESNFHFYCAFTFYCAYPCPYPRHTPAPSFALGDIAPPSVSFCSAGHPSAPTVPSSPWYTPFLTCEWSSWTLWGSFFFFLLSGLFFAPSRYLSPLLHLLIQTLFLCHVPNPSPSFKLLLTSPMCILCFPPSLMYCLKISPIGVIFHPTFAGETH